MHPFLPRLLAALEPAPRYRVALSGGRDSIALLHALHLCRERLTGELTAIHVDHGLQADSATWAAFCAGQCAQRDIPLTRLRVTVPRNPGESLEAAARTARYDAIRGVLTPGDLCLTAHHRDDQAETVLLQLLRGAGPAGLAGISPLSPLGAGRLARPFLGFGRSEIETFALAEGLEWVDDPSNTNTDFDRNFLRHEVLPVLARRWPAWSATIARSARHCAEAHELVTEEAARDLARLKGEDGSLAVEGMAGLSPGRAKALLRAWIAAAGLAAPDTARLQRLLHEMLTARPDRNPLVGWSGAEVRRFRGRLYAMPPLPRPPCDWSAIWDGRGSLALPPGLGALEILAPWALGRPLRVAFRRGGERCSPGGSPSRTLKNLMHEQGVAPWLRDYLPLVFADDALIAVAGVWTGAGAPRLSWRHGLRGPVGRYE